MRRHLFPQPRFLFALAQENKSRRASHVQPGKRVHEPVESLLIMKTTDAQYDRDAVIFERGMVEWLPRRFQQIGADDRWGRCMDPFHAESAGRAPVIGNLRRDGEDSVCPRPFTSQAPAGFPVARG